MAPGRHEPPAQTAEDNTSPTTSLDHLTIEAIARSRQARAKAERARQASAQAREAMTKAKRAHQVPAPTAAPRSQQPEGTSRPVRHSDYIPKLRADLHWQVEHAKTTQARLATFAGQLAKTQESIAQLHDEFAHRDPQRAAGHRRAASNIRQAARRTREFQRKHD